MRKLVSLFACLRFGLRMTTSERFLWLTYARKAQREIHDWDRANPNEREKDPPRFKDKATDHVRPI